MQSFPPLTNSMSGIVPASEDLYLFCFFWLGVLIFSLLRKTGFGKAGNSKEIGLLPYSHLCDEFSHRRFEKVLQGWPQLEKHTPEAFSLVVSSLLALGRPDDMGTFVAQTSTTLPHLRSGLHQVVAAAAAPACEVRRQHVQIALRDLNEHAMDVLDKAAVKELLLAFAKYNDEERVSALLADLTNKGEAAEPELLSKLVRTFLACQNLDAALGYLKTALVTPTALATPPHELITDVIKVATEAELDDNGTSSSKAWDAFRALEDVKLSKNALLLFLEWSTRQTPIDANMAAQIEKLLRKAGKVPLEAYDALLKVHASSTGDETKAFACFDEFVNTAAHSESLQTSLTGMISSCMEARNGALAEHILSWALEKGHCTLPIFSATVKVLAASKQPERVCTIYETAASCKNLVFDEALLEQIASCAEQTGNADLAQTLAKQAKKKTMQQQSPQNQLSAIRASVSEGNVDDVLSMLQDFSENGDVDTVVFNCALDFCVSSGNSATAKTVFDMMKASGSMDIASYNIMLKQCCSEGASQEAVQAVLKEMRDQGVDPNTATFNSLLSCSMTTGDFDGVWRTIGDMEKSGLSADIYTLSILFKGYKRERRSMDAPNIERALTLIKRHSVKVDENLLNVALEAILTVKDFRLLKRALDTFWESGFYLPKNASMHTYGQLIKAYGQIQSITEVWQLWTEVTEEKGMEASEQLYGQMLDVLVANNCLEDALTLFQEMKTVHRANINSQGFAVAYAMIIRGFAQQKDCERALHCYEEMKSHGTKASLVALNTLIDACSRVGDMSSAGMLFKDLQDSDSTPDLITYSTLIKGYCISDDLEQALYYFGQMQEKGIRPDAIVFNSLLDGCARKQVPALCEQVIKDMEAAGVVPSNHSASILIKLYGRCRDLDAAFRVINEMPRKYGFRANAAVYTCLMSACIGNGQLERALELRSRMVDEGIYPDERTYSTLLRGALRANSVEQCTSLVNAALDSIDKKGGSARHLLEEDLLRSVLMLTQRQDAWETHGRELSNRLRNSGIHVRLPLPSENCNRSDGFGRQQRGDYDPKRNAGGYRDQSGKDARYSHQNQQYQQRRYQAAQ